MATNASESGILHDVAQIWHDNRVSIFVVAIVAAILYKAYQSFQTLFHQETASITSLKPKKLILDFDKELAKNEPLATLEKPRVAIGNGFVGLDKKLVRTGNGATKQGPKRVAGKKGRSSPTQKSKKGQEEFREVEEGEFDIQILIFYSSLTGSTATYANQLKDGLFSTKDGVYPTLSIPTPSNLLSSIPVARTFLPPQAHNLEQIELDDFFVSVPQSSEGKKVKYMYLVVTPSYETDSPLAAFLDHLQETHHDFRIDTAPLRSLAGFSVFGFGDSSEWPSEEGKFCKDAVDADKWLGKLTGGLKGSRRIFPLGMGDVNPESTEDKKTGNADQKFREWRLHLEDAMREYAETGSLGAGADWRAAVESGDEDSDVDVAEDENEADLVDVEDLGSMIRRNPDVIKSSKNAPAKPVTRSPLPIDFTSDAGKKALEAGEGQSADRKEMVPKEGVTWKALTKQGYTIVGSHSGVKICRWTKSALRGRGSCYKFSFYGIKSHLCMETTPSLSCSNKCVFCWRHGTNPVGTTWRWKVDPPEEIFKGVVEGHYRKIKMLKGVPGVRADRFSEAFQIRHCALSLVGEPIFYPYINEFLGLLHGSKISSFLVCNAQHPAQLATLGPVTQLYVSIDASNKESLKRIDRPLHRDFWERFQKCLEILREMKDKRRTVFRLTLVKGFNVEEEVKGYADLVEKALPNFVEVKGVTYCGTSTAGEAGLTMGNVPFYEEVVDFVKALDAELARRGLEYGIGAEHAHSCCILLASKKYFIDGKWHTLINYQRFFELLAEGREFSPLEYVGDETPEWATWGNGGFNPADERVYRKGKGPKKVEAPVDACGTGGNDEDEGGGCG